jgi:uncharacterized protein (TIGR02996 family)
MIERDALLAGILAHPDEDAPRLVYADWLQEHGEPYRADFLRVQIELARLRAAERTLPYSFGDEFHRYATDGPGRVSFSFCRHHTPERIVLLQREAELLAHPDSRGSWRAGLPKYANDPGGNPVSSGGERPPFVRGFVGRVRVSLVQLLKDPAALWTTHPVEALELTAVASRATTAKVPDCTFLARVRDLSFPYPRGSPVLAPFARCPHLANLRVLHLDNVWMKDADATALAGSEYLRPAEFRFECNGLSRAGFTTLLNGPFTSRLCDLAPKSAAAWALEVIADAPLAGLRLLRLSGEGCNDAGVAALTRSRHLTGLVTLHLSGGTLTDAAAEALATWPGLASVRSLDLSGADISGAGVETLVASPYFKPIHLDLSSTTAGDLGAVALARWPGLVNLQVLSMHEAQVCDTGGLALARSPHWRDIRHLLLSRTTFRRAHGPLHERFGDVYCTYG